MKKYLLIGMALASFAAATANAHVYHNWQLVKKEGGGVSKSDRVRVDV